MKYLIYLIVILSVVVLSCSEEDFITSPSAKLEFSTDTLAFDTVFTSIGSVTKRFTVHNTHNRSINISKIYLAGGDDSPFRLNINGIQANEASEVEIPSKDSIFIFVEVTVDPTGENNPMVIQDSVMFSTNGNIQNIDLLAYGQDFHLFNGEVIKTQVWKNDKPYLIYNSLMVDSLENLTIEAGCRIHFHKKASLLVKGTLTVNGTFEKPVYFQGDRLEKIYENIPEQWGSWVELESGSLYMLGGIHFLVGSKDNLINYAVIKNATKGIQADSLGNSPKPVLTISNSRIENMSLNCLDARSTTVVASNCIFANCGSYAVALLFGGTYEFYHCTIANYYAYANRSEVSLILNNYYEYNDKTYSFDLAKAYFGNCIIYGSNTSELSLDNSGTGAFNYRFDHCLIKTGGKVEIDESRITGSILEKDPIFKNVSEYNYAIDSLSPAKNVGSLDVATLFPLDLNNVSRLADSGPDFGALEWVKTEKKEK